MHDYGTSCSCTSDNHILDAFLAGLPPHHIDTTYAITTTLGLLAKGMICMRCRFYIPLSRLKKHLKGHHKDLLLDGRTHTISQDLLLAIHHISDSFGIPLDQKLKTEWTRKGFDDPIAGIVEPINDIQCPGEGCDSLFVNYEVLHSHWRNQAHKWSNKATNKP